MGLEARRRVRGRNGQWVWRNVRENALPPVWGLEWSWTQVNPGAKAWGGHCGGVGLECALGVWLLLNGRMKTGRCKYPVLLSSHDFPCMCFLSLTNRLLSFYPSQHLPSMRRGIWGAGLQASGASPDEPQCMEVTGKDSQGEKNKCKPAEKRFPTSYNSSNTQESVWLIIKEPAQLEPNRRDTKERVGTGP